MSDPALLPGVVRARKKPIPVEAMQWTGGNHIQMSAWLTDGGIYKRGSLSMANDELGIHTLEGTMIAKRGDWIVKGAVGEFWPVREDIFAATYEFLDEAP